VTQISAEPVFMKSCVS